MTDTAALIVAAVIATVVTFATPDVLPGESARYAHPWAKRTVIFVVVACFFFMVLAPGRYPH